MSIPRQSRPHIFFRLLEALLFSACTALTLILLGLVLYEGYHLQRIYPGVQALGVPLGGLTPPQAVVALPQAIDPYLAAPLRLRYGDQVWEVASANVGSLANWPSSGRWPINFWPIWPARSTALCGMRP